MKRVALILSAAVVLSLHSAGVARAACGSTDALYGLLERIDEGASGKFFLVRAAERPGRDFFELSSTPDGRIRIEGSDNVSIATGIGWYLKYYAGVHLTWDGMTARLPDRLPPPTPERRESAVGSRYAYNYCTFSYSMAFWDWERWEREIDWMALHGINLPLMAVGMEKVWANMLSKLGYDAQETERFIAGPAFQAWWLMDNLEGWGNPSPEGWYDDRSELAVRILQRMRELDIEPVLPGYSGKMPSDAGRRLGLDAVDTGLWCGYSRPSFLRPDDPRFGEIADLYYSELCALYGDVRHFSCDPFHEGGSVRGVDLAASGRAILGAMKRRRSDAVWVVQAWQENPRRAMLEGLPTGDVLVLDLFSESRPQWGEPSSPWCREEGFANHLWAYCMLLNFGGNVGMYGKLDYTARGFSDALTHPRAGRTLAATGMTPEGIENNPVMFELLCELPWRAGEEDFSTDRWLEGYVRARYGCDDADLGEAWRLLARSVYGCPKENRQEGTCESVFCSRPVWEYVQTSEFAGTKPYYDPADVVEAARLMVAASERFEGCNHFGYDLADVVRQAVAETGRRQLRRATAAFRTGDVDAYRREYERFLTLIKLQDRLLGTRREFMLGRCLADARSLGRTETDKARLEWNARVQITTWGDRNAAERGGLHDYAHKEWNGLLGSLYYERWAVWFVRHERELRGEPFEPVDFYDMEWQWAAGTESYDAEPSESTADAAREVFAAAARIFYDAAE